MDRLVLLRFSAVIDERGLHHCPSISAYLLSLPYCSLSQPWDQAAKPARALSGARQEQKDHLARCHV